MTVKQAQGKSISLAPFFFRSQTIQALVCWDNIAALKASYRSVRNIHNQWSVK
jgi:hypothetical protein